MLFHQREHGWVFPVPQADWHCQPGCPTAPQTSWQWLRHHQVQARTWPQSVSVGVGRERLTAAFCTRTGHHCLAAHMWNKQWWRVNAHVSMHAQVTNQQRRTAMVRAIQTAMCGKRTTIVRGSVRGQYAPPSFPNWQLRARVAGLFVGVLFRSSGHGRWAGHGKTVPMSRTDHEGIQAIPYATNRKPVHANATRSRFRLSLPHLTLTVSAKAGSERCLGDVFACKTFY